MNILTFDTEEWYIEKAYEGNRSERYQVYDNYLNRILDMLDARGFKATFFCVGGLAREFPEVILKIADRGHEIGCHSNTHKWLTTFDRQFLYNDTHDAISSIEDVIGKKVVSYRAPAFSIGENNKWALEVLAECGIERDSSIYPAARDFGGFDSFPSKEPCIIEICNKQIKEFPICLTHALGKDFAFSGGGYFRLFPLWYVKNIMNKANYNMCYFHIYDLIYHKMQLQEKNDFENYYKISGSIKNRTIRMFKESVGTKGAFDKMKNIVFSYDFVNIAEADNAIDWTRAKNIQL